jgi:hypothetical protein
MARATVDISTGRHNVLTLTARRSGAERFPASPSALPTRVLRLRQFVERGALRFDVARFSFPAFKQSWARAE